MQCGLVRPIIAPTTIKTSNSIFTGQYTGTKATCMENIICAWVSRNVRKQDPSKTGRRGSVPSFEVGLSVAAEAGPSGACIGAVFGQKSLKRMPSPLRVKSFSHLFTKQPMAPVTLTMARIST